MDRFGRWVGDVWSWRLAVYWLAILGPLALFGWYVLAPATTWADRHSPEWTWWVLDIGLVGYWLRHAWRDRAGRWRSAALAAVFLGIVVVLWQAL